MRLREVRRELARFNHVPEKGKIFPAPEIVLFDRKKGIDNPVTYPIS